MAELQVRNDVEWRRIEGVVERWDHEAEGLTAAAAAMIALAVSIASAGAASALAGAASGAVGGGTLGTAVGNAVGAGFKAIVSKAAVSLINNKGNIGAVLKELGSSSSIKSLAATMLTAGIITAIPTDALALPGSAANTIVGQVQSELIENATQGVIQASVETAITGDDFSDALIRNLKTAAVASLGSVVANQLGASYRSNDIDYITHKVLHAALGCAIGAAGSGAKGCASGAFGGVAGEVLAEAIKDDILEMQDALARNNGTLTAAQERDYTQRIIFWGTYGVDIAKLAAGFGALATGLDVNVASTAAGNAAKNNAFFLIPIAVYAAKVALAGAAAYGAYQTGAELYKIATVLSSNAPQAEKDALIREAIGNAVISGALTVGGLSGLKVANALAKKYGVSAADLYKWLGPNGRKAVDDAAEAWNRGIPTWSGSGPTSGILGINAASKSNAAISNYFPKSAVEFVFDPNTLTFLVRGQKSPLLHSGLAKSINAAENRVVGGMLRRNSDGSFITDESSGHFHQNWTQEVRDVFTQTMQNYGFKVDHFTGMR